ncbi:MAG TPA: hypothetical protein VK588_03440 [Chitinophagaceae bacterium]|nr:hypothetical protein [Chitinophagaceae bacterium]
MQVKPLWTEADFESMSWHDSRLYSISFPNEKLKMTFDIDYLFKWEINKIDNLYNFWVSPCDLIFSDVLNLEINFDFKNTVGLYIDNIARFNSRASFNEQKIIWHYKITTDKGIISFEGTEFIQIVKKQPILTNSQVLDRKDVFSPTE